VKEPIEKEGNVQTTKMAVFWAVALYILVEVYQPRTSETSANFYQTTRRYSPEDSIFVLTAVRTSNRTIHHYIL
jgi:hypothetical protein